MINSLLGGRNKTIGINKITNCDGVTVTKPESIANCLNDYFSNIAGNHAFTGAFNQ